MEFFRKFVRFGSAVRLKLYFPLFYGTIIIISDKKIWNLFELSALFWHPHPPADPNEQSLSYCEQVVPLSVFHHADGYGPVNVVVNNHDDDGDGNADGDGEDVDDNHDGDGDDDGNQLLVPRSTLVFHPINSLALAAP